jgi:hypothetical protein
MAAGTSRRSFLAGAAATAVGVVSWSCADGSSTPAPLAFAPAALEPLSRVRDIRVRDAVWWACGSVLDSDDVHSPRFWRGTSPTDLVALPTRAISYYGANSELYALGVGGAGVVAIGAQTGGFHAMPRSASWYVDGDALQEAAVGPEVFGGPRSLALKQVAVGRTSSLLVGTRINRRTDLTGGAVWVSSDGHDFSLVDDAPGLRAETGEELLALGITATSAGGFVIVGDGFATSGPDATTHARVWTTTDPQQWTRVAVPEHAQPGRTSMSIVAEGDGRFVAGGVATVDGVTTLCTWVSLDAAAWSERVLTSFGTDASTSVSDITSLMHDGRHWWLGARLGSTPLLASSLDARRWQSHTLPADAPTGKQVRVAVGSDQRQLLVGVSDLDHAATYTCELG